MPSIDQDLTELLFEGLSGPTALLLAESVLGRQMILPPASEGVVDVELPCLELDERTALKNVHLRVLRYGDSLFDVELNFVLRDAEGDSSDAVIGVLHQYAMRLSQRYHVARYYAGIEPASDEDTRFFTGTERGPY